MDILRDCFFYEKRYLDPYTISQTAVRTRRYTLVKVTDRKVEWGLYCIKYLYGFTL